MIAAAGANNSQSGEECLDENTFEDPDQVRTLFWATQLRL